MPLSNDVARRRFFHFVFPGVLHVQGFEIVVGQRQFVGVELELVEEGGEAGAVTAAWGSYASKGIDRPMLFSVSTAQNVLKFQLRTVAGGVNLSAGDNQGPVMVERQGLEALLELDGVSIMMGDGSYVTFEVSVCEPTTARPHGIRYNLTFHDRHKQRLVGFDNAHAPPKPNRKKYGGRKTVTHDHKHLSLHDKGRAYEFESPGQLLSDFWNEVNKLLENQEGRQS
ncbi:MAG: hypothetical protein KY410_06700 [Proteobacteria bacterium]|nr:hypothetical protein [Pseudomonadota bacterium]